MLNGIARSVQQSRVSSVDEGWELLADLSNRFGASPDGNLNSKDQSAISSTFSRLELLEKHNPEISKHLPEARKLHESCRAPPLQEKPRQHMINSLISSPSNINPRVGKGHRSYRNPFSLPMITKRW